MLQKDRVISIIESLLFISGEALAYEDIASALSMTEDELRPVIEEMEDLYESRGIKLVRINDKLQLGTSKENAEYIKAFFDPVQKHSLSQSAMETLSIIAYKQPVTRSEIDAIRGVKCDYSVSLLLSKGLIYEAGKKNTLGRPMMFKTTDEFLRQFGIASLLDLPSIDDLIQPEQSDAPDEEPVEQPLFRESV